MNVSRTSTMISITVTSRFHNIFLCFYWNILTRSRYLLCLSRSFISLCGKIHRLLVCRGLAPIRGDCPVKALNNLMVSETRIGEIYGYVKRLHALESEKHWKHWRLSVVQVRNFYNLLDFNGFNTRRATHNFYYADCSIWPTPHVRGIS